MFNINTFFDRKTNLILSIKWWFTAALILGLRIQHIDLRHIHTQESIRGTHRFPESQKILRAWIKDTNNFKND